MQNKNNLNNGVIFQNKSNYDDDRLAESLQRDHIVFHIKFIGVIQIFESMKNLSFEMRTIVIRECIRRVAEFSLNIQRAKYKDIEDLSKVIGKSVETAELNVDFCLNLYYFSIKRYGIDELIYENKTENISFASIGPMEYSNYIGYIAKENATRVCYVFQSVSNNLANKIIHEIRNTFELRTLADANIRNFNNKFQQAPFTPQTERRGADKTQQQSPAQIQSYTPKRDRRNQDREIPRRDHSAPPLSPPSSQKFPYTPKLLRKSQDNVNDRKIRDQSATLLTPRQVISNGQENNAKPNYQSLLPSGFTPKMTRRNSEYDDQKIYLEESTTIKLLPSGFTPKSLRKIKENDSGKINHQQQPLSPRLLNASKSPPLPSTSVPNLQILTQNQHVVDDNSEYTIIKNINKINKATSINFSPPATPKFLSNRKKSISSQKIDENLDQVIWFHGKLSRDDAERFLENNGDFLVRVSTKGNRNEYILSGQFNNKIKHLTLVDPSNPDCTIDRQFDSIYNLIYYHLDNNIPIKTRNNEILLVLLNPVSKYDFIISYF